MPLSKADEIVWQDREVRFDSPPAEMQCRKGEVVIDSINSVEDTKGNNGERGMCTRISKQHGGLIRPHLYMNERLLQERTPIVEDNYCVVSSASA